MRQGLALVMVVVVGIGIYLLTDEGPEPTTTTLAIAPPTGPTVEPATSSTSSTPVQPGESTIRAALPDGTEFDVRVSPANVGWRHRRRLAMDTALAVTP